MSRKKEANLGEPAQDDLVGSGEVKQLERPRHRMKSVLKSRDVKKLLKRLIITWRAK